MLNTFEKTKAHEARRAAIQRQMEAMEAAATTGKNQNNENTSGSNSARRRSPPAPAGSLETARRFLWDEDEATAAGTGMTPANASKSAKQGGIMSRFFGGGGSSNNGPPVQGSMRNVNLNEASNFSSPDKPSQQEYKPGLFTACYIFFRNLLLTIALTVGQCCSKTRGCCEMAFGGGRGKKFGLAVLVALLVCIPVAIWSGTRDSSSRTINGISAEDRYEALKFRVVEDAVSHADVFDDPNSPQSLALNWIALEDPAKLEVNHVYLMQRYALATFYYSTHGDNMFQTTVLNVTEAEELIEASEVDGDEPVALPADGTDETIGDDLAGQENWLDEAGWMTGAGHCSWRGVECHHRPGTAVRETIYDGNHGVILLNFTDNNVRGQIPREIFTACKEIRWLGFADNGFFGTVPREIGYLQELRYLSFANNFFTGTLPQQVAVIPDLNRLYLDGNYFIGQLPEKLGQMTNLLSLSIYDNYFTGTIPEDIGNLVNMTVMYLDINHLEGTIPTTIGLMENLADLRLRHNRFNGTIPTELGNLDKMEVLYLDRNEFNGPIPTEIGKLTRMVELHGYRNKFHGEIPTELGDLDDLTSLYLDNNHLTGGIPTEFGKLNDLEQIYLHKNHMDGTIPTEIGKMENLRNFRVYTNGLKGTLPSEIGNCYNLQHLYVHDNAMEGSIPEQVSELTQLQNLRTYWNKMDGAVSKEICDLLEYQLTELKTDCAGDEPKVDCDCCTVCFT